jgi:hypothetical protein
MCKYPFHLAVISTQPRHFLKPPSAEDQVLEGAEGQVLKAMVSL